jgi:O-antigen/teichoic acid export membrane protein
MPLEKETENMDKALEMGKTSAFGSFQLLIGVAISTVIMAIGTIVLGRVMTPDDFGLYGIVLIPSGLINLFRDWGVNSAMTKYIANFRVTHRENEVFDIMVAGVIFEVAVGLALSFLSFLLSSFIASAVFRRSDSASYIAIASFSIISGSLLAASQAGFVGFERMGLNSFTLICQGIVRTALGPLLVLLGYGVLGAVLGYTLSFVISGVIGIMLFYFALLRPLKKRTKNSSGIRAALRVLLRFGFPLSVSSILGSILGSVFAFIVVPFTSDNMYGNYKTASNFGLLLTFFTIPISTVLFPAFAKLDPQKERDLAKTVFASSIKYSSILLVPATVIIMALSGPMIGTLYGEKYVYGPLFLTISVVGTLFVAIGNISAAGLLSGVGETRILLKESTMTVIFGLPFGFVLISLFGIVGFVIANVFVGTPSMFWALGWIWKHYKVKADFRSSAKILAASIIAAFAAYVSTVLLNAADWIELIAGFIIFLVVYVLDAPLIGAVSRTDIDNLRIMFSGLGPISRVINVALGAMERVALLKAPNKKEKSSNL